MSRLVLYLLLLLLCASSTSAAPTPVDIGVILALDTPVGQICQVSINMALSDFYSTHPNSTTALRLHFRDSGGDIVSAASAAVDLISNDRVTAILGPQTSATAAFVADIGAKCHVPVVAFSATSPSVSSSQSPYFVRAAVADSAAAAPVAAIVQKYGWRRVVPIYEDSDFGSSFIPFLVDALDAVGSQVPYRLSLPVAAPDDRILADLYRLKTMQTRVFVLHATFPLAPRIFALAERAEMTGQGFAWIVTDGVTGSISLIDPLIVLGSMQGVLGVKPCIPQSDKLSDFKRRWRTEFLKAHPGSNIIHVSNFGVWAYDAVFALALAAEAARPTNPGPDMNQSSSAATDLSNLPTLTGGEKFLSSILRTEFDGLAGRFRLQRGELNVSAFEIVNIVGEKGHPVGYWSPRFRLSRRLGRGRNESEMGLGMLGPVIWPGEDVMQVPKGFTEPTSAATMRIAVPGPVEPGFRSFLDVERDPVTNKTMASGYVIEVFEAAVRRLPYALQFEYVMKDAHENYTALVQQVPKKYDGVVGDVTITWMRANYVDFTMPYSVSGVAVVVPLRDEHSGRAWVFLKPLKADLWIVSGLFFIFTGLVVWLLEHRVNEEFRGPPSHQAGTIFYFIFSTLVFSHKEAIVSNLARIVVIVWVFVVLILQSSYTANLTSMLTVRQVKPTLTDMEAVLKTSENVGYLQNSFVQKFLLDMGFPPSRLKPYKSPQQYAEALARGTANEGVGAVVDEIPYLKVFLKDYCANYTITGQPNKTGGFGFGFPKGSSLVPDLSRAILNLTESDEMAEIERRWFGDPSTCRDDGSPFSSQSLSFVNFWGLFLITGAASTLCLIMYMIAFLYKNRESINHDAGDDSLRGRFRSMAKVYDQKDLKAHTFRRRSTVRRRSMAERSRNPMASPSVDNANQEDADASPSGDNIGMGSPMSMSHQEYEYGRASIELASPMAPETPRHHMASTPETPGQRDMASTPETPPHHGMASVSIPQHENEITTAASS